MEKNKKIGYSTTDEYIARFPDGIQKKLAEMRAVIRAAAPQATEKISYQIPTFYLQGNLVHFAAFKDHLSFFPASSGIAAFTDEMKAYKTAKGTLQIPLDQPLPVDLLTRIVKFRLAENLDRAAKKKR
jgi:uncharacterized protein YdhG (YjbR/CyaY superfamily)